MSLSHTFVRGWSGGGGTISKTVTVIGGSEYNIDETIAAAATDFLIACVIDVSQMKGLFITASAAMTIETNSSSAPINIFTLAADTPYAWVQGDSAIRDTAGTAFTTDVTALYVTSTLGGTLQVRILIDPTITGGV